MATLIFYTVLIAAKGGETVSSSASVASESILETNRHISGEVTLFEVMPEANKTL
jgi:hypothetical protein